MNETLVLASVLIFIYGLFSGLAEKSSLTPHMVFTGAGILCSPLGVNLFDAQMNTPAVELLATIALVIILASDASHANRRVLHETRALPLRLLAISLPLTILLGILAAWLIFPALGLGSLIFLALVLAPTDAALGQAVINNTAVPVKVREALNVESGLNDGICLPAVFAVLYYLGAKLGAPDSPNWIRFAAMQILLGPVAGALIGVPCSKLIDFCAKRGWLDQNIQRLFLPALALLGYAFAEIIGGNGFIAAFFVGFTLAVRTESVREETQEFSESEGMILSLLTFLILGLVMIPSTVEHWTLNTTLYALLSLTLVRIIPVAIGLIGAKLDWQAVLFMGWFGPGGIASILYLLMLVSNIGIEGYETVLSTGVQAILFSVVLHGATASPLAKRYGALEAKRLS